MKKTFWSVCVLVLGAASAAQAEGFQVETRAFHSNIRLSAGRIVSYTDGIRTGEQKSETAFFNTAGVGINGTYAVDEQVEVGLGYSLARYYPVPDVYDDQHIVQAFSRWNMLKTERSRTWFLAGVSQHQWTVNVDTEPGESLDYSFTPVLNYDIGFGSSINLGPAVLGLDYKYSNTLVTGQGRFVGRYAYQLIGSEEKVRVKDVEFEHQEVALSLGFPL